MESKTRILFYSLLIFLAACKTVSKNVIETPVKSTSNEFSVQHESAKVPKYSEIENEERLRRLQEINIIDQQPPITVYKTKGNYNNLVPIRLSDDKTQIVSYPAPSDLKKDGKFLYPTELEGGLLIDNLGISKNSAFIKLTYEEYAALQNTLPLSELFKLIVDKAPFLEMYDCGNKQSFTNLKEQLNDQIRKGEFKKLYKRTF
jgi:hypothetical protein